MQHQRRQCHFHRLSSCTLTSKQHLVSRKMGEDWTTRCGVVLDMYFKIGRKHEESFSSFELRGTRAHNELKRVMTALLKEDAKEVAKENFKYDESKKTIKEGQLEEHIVDAVSKVEEQGMPSIVGGWQFLKNSNLFCNLSFF